MPDPLSESELRRRAQLSLDRTTDRLAQNIPSIANFPRPFVGLPKLRLDDLPPTAQGAFLRVARHDAEALVRQERSRKAFETSQSVKQTVQSKKLEEWFERKFKQEEEAQQRESELEKEKEERERLQDERRRKRNDDLQRRLSDWAMEKDEKERQSAAAAEKAARAEEERRKRATSEYRARQKTELEAWHRRKAEREVAEKQEAEQRRLREKEDEDQRLKEEEERVARVKQAAKSARRRHHWVAFAPPPGCELYAASVQKDPKVAVALQGATPRVH